MHGKASCNDNDNYSNSRDMHGKASIPHTTGQHSACSGQTPARHSETSRQQTDCSSGWLCWWWCHSRQRSRRLLRQSRSNRSPDCSCCMQPQESQISKHYILHVAAICLENEVRTQSSASSTMQLQQSTRRRRRERGRRTAHKKSYKFVQIHHGSACSAAAAQWTLPQLEEWVCCEPERLCWCQLLSDAVQAYDILLPFTSVAQPQVGEALLPPASHEEMG